MNKQIKPPTQIFGNGRRALISGASIAGPTLAYWLQRYGFSVTVIEQSEAIRLGGYPVDVRGTAMLVAERMELQDELFSAHIHTARATFVDGDGDEIAVIQPELVHGAVPGRDVELPRGELTSLLFLLTRRRVSYRFKTSIVTLDDQVDGVEVTFADGSRETYDIVIGADGVHSHTRKLVFGPESDFARPIGFCFAGFSSPNVLGLSREAICWNVPSQLAALYAVDQFPEKLFTLLAFAHPHELGPEGRDPAFQRDLIEKAFSSAGWKLPNLIKAMKEADDLYFDSVGQIVMPSWTKGRVALVGDAAYAPSFLTGQGTSLALVGAYVLASELALDPDHRKAFSAYEKKLRPFVEMNQATVNHGKVGMIPSTPEQLEQRRAELRSLVGVVPEEQRTGRASHNAFDLSDYAAIQGCSGTSTAVRT